MPVAFAATNDARSVAVAVAPRVASVPCGSRSVQGAHRSRAAQG